MFDNIFLRRKAFLARKISSEEQKQFDSDPVQLQLHVASHELCTKCWMDRWIVHTNYCTALLMWSLCAALVCHVWWIHGRSIHAHDRNAHDENLGPRLLGLTCVIIFRLLNRESCGKVVYNVYEIYFCVLFCFLRCF